jgi:protein O-mannosyl-transferase
VRMLIRVVGPSTAPKHDSLDNSIAVIAALFFALHPVQVESVAWISELKGELACMFGLLGLWWHYRSTKRLLVAAFFVAAMLSKPSAIVFPAVVLLIDRIVLRKSLAKSAITSTLYGAALLIFALVTKHLQPDFDQDFIPTAGQRLIVATDAISFYVGKVLVPFPLAADYGRSPRVVLEHTSRLWLAYSALLSVAGIGMVVRAVIRPPSSVEADRW